MVGIFWSCDRFVHLLITLELPIWPQSSDETTQNVSIKELDSNWTTELVEAVCQITEGSIHGNAKVRFYCRNRIRQILLYSSISHLPLYGCLFLTFIFEKKRIKRYLGFISATSDRICQIAYRDKLDYY